MSQPSDGLEPSTPSLPCAAVALPLVAATRDVPADCEVPPRRLRPHSSSVVILRFHSGSNQSIRSRWIGVGWFELALLPEPRPKARNLPTRYGARDVGAQANRIRLAGPAFVVSSRR